MAQEHKNRSGVKGPSYLFRLPFPTPRTFSDSYLFRLLGRKGSHVPFPRRMRRQRSHGRGRKRSHVPFPTLAPRYQADAPARTITPARRTTLSLRAAGAPRHPTITPARCTALSFRAASVRRRPPRLKRNGAGWLRARSHLARCALARLRFPCGRTSSSRRFAGIRTHRPSISRQTPPRTEPSPTCLPPRLGAHARMRSARRLKGSVWSQTVPGPRSTA